MMRKETLWLKLCGLDDNEMGRLDTPMTAEDELTTFAKRRYCVPLERLKTRIPRLGLARLRDLNDPYQPCCGVGGQYRHVETGTIDMSTAPTRQSTGWVRLPISVFAPNASDNPECLSPKITITRLPLGWSWDFPWRRFRRMGYDQLRAEFGKYKVGAQWLKNEERRMATDGPLIHIMNQSRASADTTFSYSCECFYRGETDFYCADPPLCVFGLVFDKQTQRFL